MIEICNIGSYRIGSDNTLTEEHKRQLVSCFARQISINSGTLGGRAEIATIQLGDIGPAVVKRYTRGGAIRLINSSNYLKIFQYRCQAEFALLLNMKKLGISVPDPIAFAYQGSIIYKAWLITREIPHARTLVEISTHEPGKLKVLMPRLMKELDSLIENRIHHVDLHPGNVIVNDHDELFIIDFDKAQTNVRNRKKLQQKYVKRWQRAVTKHNLPVMLNFSDNENEYSFSVK